VLADEDIYVAEQLFFNLIYFYALHCDLLKFDQPITRFDDAVV
jgi:hypothetical protein